MCPEMVSTWSGLALMSTAGYGLDPEAGWPEPAGFLPQEALEFIQLICEPLLAGIEVVECDLHTTTLRLRH